MLANESRQLVPAARLDQDTAVFSIAEYEDMWLAVYSLSHLPSPNAVLDSIEDIEDVRPDLKYRCHICGIPWGH